MNFKNLEEVVHYIMDGEDTGNYRWNNDAGDWDIEDIQRNAAMYDAQYSEYTINPVTYDIDGEGERIFTRTDDADV